MIDILLLWICLLGLTMIESGSIRECNRRFPYYKLMTNLSWGTLIFLVFGNRILNFHAESGYGSKFFYAHEETQGNYGKLFRSLLKAQIATTIAQFGIAGRTSILGYLMHTVFFMGVAYPILENLFTNPESFIHTSFPDFQDEGMAHVHVFSGTASILGAIIVGSRKNRWKDPDRFVPHDFGQIGLGVMAYSVGSFGFYPQTSSDLLSRCMANAMLAMAGAGMVAMFFTRFMSKLHNAVHFTRATMCGLVGASAGIAGMDTQWALLTGCIAGITYLLFRKTVEMMHIDAPCASFSVHAVGGLVSLVVISLFDENRGWIGEVVTTTTAIPTAAGAITQEMIDNCGGSLSAAIAMMRGTPCIAGPGPTALLEEEETRRMLQMASTRTQTTTRWEDRPKGEVILQDNIVVGLLVAAFGAMSAIVSMYPLRFAGILRLHAAIEEFGMDEQMNLGHNTLADIKENMEIDVVASAKINAAYGEETGEAKRLRERQADSEVGSEGIASE